MSQSILSMMRLNVSVAILVLAGFPLYGQDQCVLKSGYVLKQATKQGWTVQRGSVERTGKWEKFPQSEVESVRNYWMRRDSEQFEKVRAHLAALHENPEAVSGILVQLHKDYPESPYAGLWAGVATAAGKNDAKAAERLLSQARERVEIQQCLAPEFHRLTLASIYNNLAICDIKQKSGAGAAGNLIQALDVNKYSSPVVSQNIRQLLRFSEMKSAITYSTAMRNRLLGAVTSSEVQGVGAALEEGWHYSLDFDVPDNAAAAKKIRGIDAPAGNLELLSIGTGVVLANGIVVTARPNLEIDGYDGPLLVTVCHPTPSGWASLRAENVIVESGKTTPTNSTVRSGAGGTVVWSDFKHTLPSEGQPASELAALRVNGLPVKPAYIASAAPQAGQQVRVCSYKRSDTILDDGLQLLSCQISKTGRSPTRCLELSTSIDGGARGAPLVDEASAVIGLAFGFAAGEEGAEGGRAFSIDEVRNWFYRHVQTSEMTKLDSGVSDAAARLRQATIPVLCWGYRQRTIFSKISDDSRPSGGSYLTDGWCVSCDGKGTYKCATCKGLGKVSEKRQVQVAYDVKTGPVYAARVFYNPCPTCSGKCLFQCPHCKNGRLP